MSRFPNWSETEEIYLMEKWGQISIPTIAKNLGRSVNSVLIRANRLKLGPHLMGGDYISANQLMQALKGQMFSTYYKTSWIKNRGLPVHTKTVNKCRFKVVYLDEFWEWAEKNRSFIDFSKLEPFSLGKEPKWVNEQRKADRAGYSIQRKDPWTPYDDALLLSLLEEQKYGYMELSRILRRSDGAIQRRCRDLKTKLRPVRRENHIKWRQIEFEILDEGIRNG